MAGVGPAQKLLVREVGDAGGGDELAAEAGALGQGGVRPTQQPAGVIGERCGRGERRPDERGAPARLQAVADDVADDEHGGIVRPLSHQVKVAADLFGGCGQEGRSQLQAGRCGSSGGVSASRIARRSSSSCSAALRRSCSPANPRRALRRLREGARSASPGGALGVGPSQVVQLVEASDRCLVAEGAVWAAMVVGPEPAVKGGGAFAAGAVDRAVGPAGEQGADEAFGLAVGARPVGAGA